VVARIWLQGLNLYTAQRLLERHAPVCS
jgi:hypothetical protein